MKIWLFLPLALNLMICLIALFCGNATKAISCFLGGLVAIIPQAVFGFFCFRFKGAQQSRKIWQSFARGEAVKLLLTAILFALIYYFTAIEALWFFLAFIMMQILVFLINCRLLEY